ncbi:MAG TPA: hypothetical protein P5555_04210 [Candidatus Paceibacterota bacterium]|nr:hypothetical protein [Verrucomicrobiota bacterium]HOX02684.1 hypothetical protein [Verrucomicrobiota bacterium]HRZ44375.1 hypothetical protein [Candidatus Paceibacterota bacterium]HRZ93783.1 hypothetical protein [Candidatus Paceibacterota bacterium]
MIDGTEELARRLRQLEPARHGIDRDTLMFQAGRRSTQRRLRAWQSLAGLIVFVAAGLAWLDRNPWPPAAPMMAALGNAPRTEQPSLPNPSDRAGINPLPANLRGTARDYLELRTRVAIDGWDTLPSSACAPASADAVLTIADWLRLRQNTFLAPDPFKIFRSPTKGNPS